MRSSVVGSGADADPAIIPGPEAMVAAGASACTDVTGFGLLGHLHIALEGSGASARIDAAALPLLPGVLDLAGRGIVPSGTRANHAFVAPTTDWGELPEDEQLVVADAQTSGGLLIAIGPDRADGLREQLRAREVEGAEIGAVEEGSAGAISLVNRLPRE